MEDVEQIEGHRNDVISKGGQELRVVQQRNADLLQLHMQRPEAELPKLHELHAVPAPLRCIVESREVAREPLQ